MDDYYLAETVHGEIVRVRNLPNTMKEPVAQWHPGVMRALSVKSIQTSDDEFTATDFRHVAQLLRSTDDKVVRASLSNWINAIVAAREFAVEFEPNLSA